MFVQERHAGSHTRRAPRRRARGRREGDPDPETEAPRTVVASVPPPACRNEGGVRLTPGDRRALEMVDATRLGGVVGDFATWESELVVEADAGCECEESCRDAGAEVARGAGAVTFEPEQVFEGEKDGFDPLPDRRKSNAAVGARLRRAGRTTCRRVRGRLARTRCGVSRVARRIVSATAKATGQQGQENLALGTVGSREGRSTRGAVQSTEQA